MKLGWMIVIAFSYLVITGIIASKITESSSGTIVVWFLFVLLWNKFSKHLLPPVELYDTRDVTKRNRN